MNKSNDDGGGIGFLLFIPILFVVILFSGLGWIAGVKGASYRTVKALVYPVSFAISQLFGGLLFLCFGWLLALLIGSTNMANYVVGNVADLTLLALFYGELGLPVLDIVVFQLVVWFVIGRRLARHLAFSIYDSAIQTVGQREGIHPYYVRERVRQNDSGYAKAEQIYVKSGKPPLLGLIMVGASQTPISEYY